ncbi:MAG: hypothetical protein QOG69_2225 [Actinomycetota bacterium]|nr:hypothetical protein [Actinomycetota bacterium]
MRLPRGPHLVSLVFGLVLALALGAVAWGVTHDGSVKHGFGTSAQQVAARQALALKLPLPSMMTRDKTFTACGMPGDDCLTSTTTIASTLTALGVAFRTAGGSLARKCTVIPVPTPGDGPVVPAFSCLVEGRLAGGWVIVALGDGWLLPGSPTPKTAALIEVETPPTDVSHASLPSTRPEKPNWVLDGWTVRSVACTDPNAPAASAAPSATPLPTAVPTGTVTLPPELPPPPACEPHATTIAVSAPVKILVAAKALAKAASADGYRLDGLPCVPFKTFIGCQVQGAKREVGNAGSVVHTMIARLTADANGQMTGYLTLTDIS